MYSFFKLVFRRIHFTHSDAYTDQHGHKITSCWKINGLYRMSEWLFYTIEDLNPPLPFGQTGGAAELHDTPNACYLFLSM